VNLFIALFLFCLTVTFLFHLILTTMLKTEVLSAIAEKTGLTKKEVDAVIVNFTNLVINEVYAKGDKINFETLGTFKRTVKKGRAARLGRNPATGNTINIPATQDKNIIKFVPAAPFR